MVAEGEARDASQCSNGRPGRGGGGCLHAVEETIFSGVKVGE